MDVSGNGGSIGVEIVCTGSIVSEELTDENEHRFDPLITTINRELEDLRKVMARKKGGVADDDEEGSAGDGTGSGSGDPDSPADPSAPDNPSTPADPGTGSGSGSGGSSTPPDDGDGME